MFIINVHKISERHCADVTCCLCVVSELRSSGVSRFWLKLGKRLGCELGDQKEAEKRREEDDFQDAFSWTLP